MHQFPFVFHCIAHIPLLLQLNRNTNHAGSEIQRGNIVEMPCQFKSQTTGISIQVENTAFGFSPRYIQHDFRKSFCKIRLLRVGIAPIVFAR